MSTRDGKNAAPTPTPAPTPTSTDSLLTTPAEASGCCSHDHDHHNDHDHHSHGHDHQSHSYGSTTTTKVPSNNNNNNNKIERQSFHVQGICCASEVPTVKSIIESLSGPSPTGTGTGSGSSSYITKVSINITTKNVIVEYNPDYISPLDIKNELDKEYFDCTILETVATVTSKDKEKKKKESCCNGNMNGSEESAITVNGVSNTNTNTSITSAASILTKHNLRINIILSGIFWIISLIGKLQSNPTLLQLGILSVIFGLPPILFKAYRTIRRYQFDANCMMVTAAIGALCMGEYDEAASVAFLFSISEYLEDGATRRGRDALNEIINLKPEIANLIVTNENANASTNTNENENTNSNYTNGDITIEIIPVDELQVGDIVTVSSGDKIPSDGLIVEGHTRIDESSFTGESKTISKSIGDAVSGGTVNVGHTRIIVQITSTVRDSALSRLIRLVEESAANRSPTELIVDAFARSYTPSILLIAFLMSTIPWIIYGSGNGIGRQWTLNGLIIVVIACPCALTISTPVTYAAGLAATAQRGIIVKGGSKLEALGNVRQIIFDKTGTLTEGKFQLLDLRVVVGASGEGQGEGGEGEGGEGGEGGVGGRRGKKKKDKKKLKIEKKKWSRHEVLELLAIMEGPSSHPLAAALVNAARDEGVTISNSTSVLNHSILKGEGVTATVNGQEMYVGNDRLFRRLGMYDLLDDDEKEVATTWNYRGGRTVGFIGIGGVGIIGMFSVADAARREARGIVRTLMDDGIDVFMLTGDGSGPAEAIAAEVGIPIENVQSQCKPEDKLHRVTSILESTKQDLGGRGGRGRGRGGVSLFGGEQNLLMMCGDGVNDAPALAAADVGVAMGEGAALALEISDVTLMDSNLSKLLFSIQTGRKVISTVKENIFFSVAAKMVLIVLTLMGRMTLLAAIAADVGVMLIVSINGMKLLPGGPGLSCCGNRHEYKSVDLHESDGEHV